MPDPINSPSPIVFNWRDINSWLLALILLSNIVAAYRTGQPIDLPPIKIQAEPGAHIQVTGPAAPSPEASP